MSVREVKIFVSSPGDVNSERALAFRVIKRLQREYVEHLKIVPVLWERLSRGRSLVPQGPGSAAPIGGPGQAAPGQERVADDRGKGAERPAPISSLGKRQGYAILRSRQICQSSGK
jgi:hypothetical protein